MNPAIAWYQKHFQQVQASLPALALTDAADWRSQQLAQFLVKGFPNRRQENWRYTDLTALQQQLFRLANAETSVDVAPYAADYRLKNPQQLRLVFNNGYCQAAASQLAALPQGVILLPIAQALQSHPQHILPYLQQTAAQPLVNLNTAFMMDGVFLYVPPGCILQQPIELLYLSAARQAAMQQLCTIIKIDERAQLTLFEQHVSLTGAAAWNNLVAHIDIAANAKVNYVKLQQEALTTSHIAQITIKQQADSELQIWQCALGAQLAHENWQINLAGKNAATVLQGVYAANEKQHLAQHLLINHLAPRTASHTYYRGLATDHASAVFNGKIKVLPEAQKTQAKLTNKNLLLASTAAINTKPELEIYADDVQCAHGATVGQLDETALFYLRARGIEQFTAQQLLLQAFAETGLQTIPNTEIKALLQNALQQKLQGFTPK